MRNVFNKKNQGFTLIELLVVIAIIGILAAVVLVSLNSARAKSRDARRVADVRQIMTALEIFYNDNSRYPTATSGVPTVGDGSPTWSTYIALMPSAPLPFETACTALNNTYTYAQTGSGTGYTLGFCLGGVTGGLPAGVHTASPAGIQ
ncbi:MAG: prepilin-type N-terminal cleavage/methylation domain-containing protein [Candidatus Doudnabacteria bacterium]